MLKEVQWQETVTKKWLVQSINGQSEFQKPMADKVPNLGKRNVVCLLGCAVQGGDGSLYFRWAREEDALGHAKTRCLMTTARRHLTGWRMRWGVALVTTSLTDDRR